MTTSTTEGKEEDEEEMEGDVEEKLMDCAVKYESRGWFMDLLTVDQMNAVEESRIYGVWDRAQHSTNARVSDVSCARCLPRWRQR